jgi:hypothetical protein
MCKLETPQNQDPPLDMGIYLHALFNYVLDGNKLTGPRFYSFTPGEVSVRNLSLRRQSSQNQIDATREGGF